ncbi:11489_t:CDS:2 [Acaulospora colombiana]|uniref:11489_t:CDS:1 n=1 Tax=Acaulospora colombiana TaxID=27376 RepID=A0ACA9L8D3_9GLOM|nr:11489_t:CDS:2 [Acaulospora colombiana]
MALPEEIKRRVPSTDSSSSHQSTYHDLSPTSSYVYSRKRKPSEKRFATYELNWNSSSAENNSTDDEFLDPEDHTSHANGYSGDSAQVARKSVQSTPSARKSVPLTHQQELRTPQLSTPSSPLRRPTSSVASTKKPVNPITINTSVREPGKHDDSTSPQSPFGGITVTTVKVVEILHSPTTDNSDVDSSLKATRKPSQIAKSDLLQRKRQQQLSLLPEPSISSENSSVGSVTIEQKRKRHPVSSPPVPVTSAARVVNPGRLASKIRQEPTQRLSIIPDSVQNQKKRTSVIAPLKGKSINRISLINSSKGKQPIVPKEMAFIDPRLIAKRSLVRTQSIVRSNNVTGKSIKRGTSTLRKRAPPRNMEFAPTSNPAHSNDPTDVESDTMPRRVTGLPWLPGPPKPPKLLHASLVPLPNRAQRAASTNPNRASRIIPTNPNRTSRILSTINPKRDSRRLSNIFSNKNGLTRANSLRRRSSVLAPLNRRASLDFRRKLLEESIMSSFGGGAYGVKPQTHLKPPIRRKTKKGSNAKLEDHRNQEEAVGANNAVKRLEMTRIISSQELLRKVEEENRRKENMNGPQPPPRRSPNEVTNQPEYFPPVSSRSNNTLSLLSSPPERRPSKPENSQNSLLQSSEPPPFPAHLSRSTVFSEHNRLQYPSSSSSASSSIPSRMAPATSEDSDRPSKNGDDTYSHPSSPSPRTQKLGILGGLFNKQVASSGSSHIPVPSPPTTYISQPPSLIPTRSAPPPPIANPPLQSPPLSPSRTPKIQSQLPRLTKGRRTNETDQATPNSEKLRKMEQFEALIAGSEPSTGKKSKPGKMSALTNLIMTSSTAASTSSSASTAPSSSVVDKKKKVADGPPATNGRRKSNGSGNNNQGRGDGLKSNLDVERLSIEKYSTERSSLNSLAVSLADSVHYRPEEKDALGKPGAISEDGVIRVTLTPAVCR